MDNTTETPKTTIAAESPVERSDIENLLDMQLKTLSLSDLVPDPNNPRVHTEENVNEIAESIKTLGFNNPLQVVPLDDGRYKIVAGHGRYLALLKLGATKAPCAILKHLEGDDARALAANIADNEIALHSYYDEQKLAEALNTLTDLGEHLVQASGIDMDRYMDIAYGNADIVEDKFELNDTTVSSYKASFGDDGDTNKFDAFVRDHLTANTVYEFSDNHRLLYGDRTDPNQMTDLVSDATPKLMITETPEPNSLKQKVLDEYRAYWTEALGVAGQLIENGAFYVMYPDAATESILNAIKDAGLFRRQNLIWLMNNLSVTGNYDYRILHENIAYATAGGTDAEALDAPIMHQDIAYGYGDKKVRSWSGDKRQPTVIQIDANSTTKPLKLVGYFIKQHTVANDTVLDLMAGNGTELIACEQLHRRYLGVDNDGNAILTTMARYAEDTHYTKPIVDTTTGEDLTPLLQDLAKR